MTFAVSLPNIDSKIWNLEFVIIDIISEILAHQHVDICLNSEGPCAESLGLYRVLDGICEKFGLPKNRIRILTCNQIENHPEYAIKKYPPLYIPETQQFAQTSGISSDKNFASNFKHFGIFIGRSNWIRLWIAGVMRDKYKNKTMMTYHWKPNDEFHAAHIGLDDMLRWNADLNSIDAAKHLLQYCPLGLSEKNEYPIVSPAHLNICRVYPKFFLEVVCETYYSGMSFYPTEKIWRPLLMKTPFLIHGPVEYLRNLRALGFRTFETWWSEEYDNYGHDQRINRILNTVEQLQQLSIVELHGMYQDMMPALEHNHRVFMSLSPSDFGKVFHYA